MPYAEKGLVKNTSRREAVVKDSITEQLIPQAVSECALYLDRKTNEPCVRAPVAQEIGVALGIGESEPAKIIAVAKEKLGCDNERCVLGKMSSALGEDIVRKEISEVLKVRGPTDTQLLSNVNIDSVLQQWKGGHPYLYPHSFNMLNYASYSYKNGYILNQPDSLATVSFADLYNGKINNVLYRCTACVINSDTYQGPGKHWMALFADSRGDDWSVEFFNSSGNSPAPEWVSWMVKTKNAMEGLRESATPVQLVKVSNIRHQQSRTECGLYSLFYIWARLHGIPYSYFANHPVPDQLMFEFRSHLFDDPKRMNVKKFDWDAYSSEVKIEWE